jgi:hypothetical protein
MLGKQSKTSKPSQVPQKCERFSKEQQFQSYFFKNRLVALKQLNSLLVFECQERLSERVEFLQRFLARVAQDDCHQTGEDRFHF